MVCIYCGSETEVSNSRSKARTPSVWRRRVCKTCVAQFSTLELPDYSITLAVQSHKDKKLEPFSRDELFLSLYKALGHRLDATHSAPALTTTVIGKVLRKYPPKNGIVLTSDIARVSIETLKRFDPAAAASYKAYHQEVLKTR